MRSLVVQTSFIGDVVLTTPLISRLARDGEVDVVTTKAGATLLQSHPSVSRVFTYEKRGSDSGLSGMLRLSRAVRGAQTAYLCQGSPRSGALAVAAGVRERVGFDTSSGRVFYTSRTTYRDDWHHARRLLSLADLSLANGIADSELRPSLNPTPDDLAAVDAMTRGLSRPMIALAPGSAWGTKRWPGFAHLGAIIGEEFDIVVIGGADNPAVAAEVKRAVPDGRAVDASDRLTLLGSAELIRRCVVLVSNDSSPQHLASAMGTPTLTIFGPTVPAFGFGPLAPGSRTAGLDGLACRPCDRHGPRACPLGHWRCMNEISPMEIAEMVRSMAHEAGGAA